MILFEKTPKEIENDLENERADKYYEKEKSFTDEDKELRDIVKGISIQMVQIMRDRKYINHLNHINDAGVETFVEDVIEDYDYGKHFMWKDRIEELQTFKKCKFIEELK
jgi:hypothetical protein